MKDGSCFWWLHRQSGQSYVGVSCKLVGSELKKFTLPFTVLTSVIALLLGGNIRILPEYLQSCVYIRHGPVTRQIWSYELHEVWKFYTKTRRVRISHELLTAAGNNRPEGKKSDAETRHVPITQTANDLLELASALFHVVVFRCSVSIQVARRRAVCHFARRFCIWVLGTLL